MKLLLVLPLMIVMQLSFAQDSSKFKLDKATQEKNAAEFKATKKMIDEAYEIAKNKNFRVNGADVKRELIEKLIKENKDPKKFEFFLNKLGTLDPNLTPDKLKTSIDDLLVGKGFVQTKPKVCFEEQRKCADSSDCCNGLACSMYIDEEVPADSKTESRLQLRCLKAQELNSECTPFKSTCKQGVCTLYYSNSTSLPICKARDAKCTKDDECCTGYCKSGSCATTHRCLNCLGPGKKPRDKEVCCPGYYKDEEGKCITDEPPMPPVSIKRNDRNILFKFLEFIIPTAQAQVTPTPTATPNPNANMTTCEFNARREYFTQLYNSNDAPPIGSSYANQGAVSRAAHQAAWAFEFFALGAGVQDYWIENGQNIHTRAQAIAQKLKAARITREGGFAELDKFMACNCYSLKWEKLTAAQRDLFKVGKQCEAQIPLVASLSTQAMAANQANTGSSMIIDPDGLGAAGIKYQAMMMDYYAKRIQIQAKSFHDTTVGFEDLQKMSIFLSAQKWNDYVKVTDPPVIKDEFKSWIEMAFDWLVNLIASVINFFFGAFFEFLKSLIYHPQCSGVASSIKSDFQNPNPKCTTDSWDDHYVLGVPMGKTTRTTCVREKYGPNSVCGTNNRNAFCMRSAYKRTENSKAAENIFLIDPPAPIGYTSLDLNMQIASKLDFNDQNKLCNWNPPNFTDAHYVGIRDLAAQYARDNDFYQTEAEIQAWAVYAVDEHFLRPYTSRPREMNYDLPGLIPYFNDLTTKFSYILAYGNNQITNDQIQLNNWSQLYYDTVNKLGAGNSKYLPHKVDVVRKNIELAQFHMANLQSQTFNNQEPFKSGKLGESLTGAAIGGMYNGLNSLANYNKKQKAKYDYWVANVGNTPKGQAMQNAKAALQSSQVIGGNNSSGTSGGGFNSSSSNQNSLASTRRVEDTKKGAVKKLESSLDDGGRYSNSGGKPANYTTQEDVITDQKEIETILSEAKSNMYDAHEGDSLWKIVTKAYVRSAYPHLLKYKPNLETKEVSTEAAPLIDDEKVFSPEKSKKRKIKNNELMN